MTQVHETCEKVYMLYEERRKNTRFRGRKRGEKKMKKRGKKVLTKEKTGGILSELSPRRGCGRSPFGTGKNKIVLDTGGRSW